MNGQVSQFWTNLGGNKQMIGDTRIEHHTVTPGQEVTKKISPS